MRQKHVLKALMALCVIGARVLEPSETTSEHFKECPAVPGDCYIGTMYIYKTAEAQSLTSDSIPLQGGLFENTPLGNECVKSDLTAGEIMKRADQTKRNKTRELIDAYGRCLAKSALTFCGCAFDALGECYIGAMYVSRTIEAGLLLTCDLIVPGGVFENPFLGETSVKCKLTAGEIIGLADQNKRGRTSELIVTRKQCLDREHLLRGSIEYPYQQGAKDDQHRLRERSLGSDK